MGEPIRSDTIKYGANAENVKYADNRYVRCSRCGYICHSDRDHSEPLGSHAGWGTVQPNTTLNGTVSVGATTINVVSTTGFPSTGYIYIYDSGQKYSSTQRMNKVTYTGITSTSFTGCTNAKAHATAMVVRGEQTDIGCPRCGTYRYK
jgi:uncharacterized C2H2 Zn-finger protein